MLYLAGQMNDDYTHEDQMAYLVEEIEFGRVSIYGHQMSL